jgi:hypothetical protein
VGESWWREVEGVAAADVADEPPALPGRALQQRRREGHARTEAPIDRHRSLTDYRRLVLGLSRRKR